MMKKRRLAMCLLVLLLGVMVLGACSSKPSVEDVTDPTASPASPTQPAAASPTVIPTLGPTPTVAEECPGQIPGFTLSPTIEKDVTSGKKLVIRVSYHDVSNQFAPGIDAGVKAAAKDLNVDAVMIGPVGANASQQVSQLEDVIAKGVDGLAISSASTDALAPIINRALDDGIPVVTFNTDNPSSNRLAFVGQDLYHSGQIAGDLIAKAMNEKGKIIITTLDAAAEWSIERVGGAKQALSKYPGIEVVEVLNTGTEPQGIYAAVESAMTANPDVTGLLSMECCSVTPDGLWVQRNNLVGKVQVVGFDTVPSTLELIQEGVVYATIYQDPYKQGYDSVELLVNFLHGQCISNVDTGAVVVDTSNVDQFLVTPTPTPNP